MRTEMTPEEMDVLHAERDEARSEVARLKAEVEDCEEWRKHFSQRVFAAEKEVERLKIESAGLGVQRLRARQERDETRAQVAAMREALERCVWWLRHIAMTIHGIGFDCLEQADAALASDAGKGWHPPGSGPIEMYQAMRKDGYLSPEQARALVDRMVEECAKTASKQGDWRAANAIRALDRSKLLKGT